MRSSNSGNLWALLVRVLLVLGLLFSVYLVGVRAIAYRYSTQNDQEGLRKAIAWEPENPDYYARLGHVLQESITETNPAEIVSLFETATRLSPYSARYWVDLAGAHEWNGRETEARKAYERARDLYPNSPQINWHLGNSYLREEAWDQAFQALQKTIVADPLMRSQVFDLAWRATEDGPFILERLIPAQTEILSQYLNYLCQNERVDEAEQAWARILTLDLPLEPTVASLFFQTLISHERVGALIAARQSLTERIPSLARRPRPDNLNMVINGDFEDKLLNAGLDWNIVPIRGAVVSTDNLIFFDGTYSLRIEFDGQHNLRYDHVYQYVPVKPNTQYQFIAYIRTRGITTDSGPRFVIYDAYEPSAFSVLSDNLTGTSNWAPRQLEFRTGPKTRLLLVRVGRYPSRKLGNQIAGTIWIDHVTLFPVE